MREATGSLQGLTSSIRGIVGPWVCEKCGHLTQYADVQPDINRVFCRFLNCDFWRVIDKRHHLVVEDDGTTWEFDPITGEKWRVPNR